MSAMDELIRTLTLEPIEVNLFRGRTPPDEHFRIYGGQVIAQALLAAYKTVEGRSCHSLQSYFIRPGDPRVPVLYQVERSRDGKSFTTRRVIAIQHGEQILNLAASFQVPEQGLEHQVKLPDVPRPDEIPDEMERMKERMANAPEEMKKHMMRERPIEMRPVNPPIFGQSDPKPMPPEEYIWFRAKKDMGDELVINQALLAWASDLSLLSVALRPHGMPWGKLQTASLDHHVWFHRPTNFSQWHLYAMDSPSSSASRGFNRGTIYREDGTIVASTAQEGLMRLRG